jgi:hypothetical protein
MCANIAQQNVYFISKCRIINGSTTYINKAELYFDVFLLQKRKLQVPNEEKNTHVCASQDSKSWPETRS